MSATSDSSDRRAVEVVVSPEDEGERADVVLGRRVPALSRRVAKSLARAGQLRVDGRRSSPAHRVRAGERLELGLELASDQAPDSAPAFELEVLHTSERFVYVNKPAGVHTVALTPGQPGVLATAVAAAFPECAAASDDPREGGAVHRLDRPTSGVVAFARSPAVWAAARSGFSDERVAKHYLAVIRPRDPRNPGDGPDAPHTWPPALPVDGLRAWLVPLDTTPPALEALVPPPSSGLGAPFEALLRHAEPRAGVVQIRAALGRGGPQTSAVRLDGRRASTLVRPLAFEAGHRLVHLLLETGRRHQARVHLAWIGWPIRGDTAYGQGSGAPEAIDLHALAIDLSAVFSEEMSVYAPPPPDFWPPVSARDRESVHAPTGRP